MNDATTVTTDFVPATDAEARRLANAEYAAAELRRRAEEEIEATKQSIELDRRRAAFEAAKAAARRAEEEARRARSPRGRAGLSDEAMTSASLLLAALAARGVEVSLAAGGALHVRAEGGWAVLDEVIVDETPHDVAEMVKLGTVLGTAPTRARPVDFAGGRVRDVLARDHRAIAAVLMERGEMIVETPTSSAKER